MELFRPSEEKGLFNIKKHKLNIAITGLLFLLLVTLIITIIAPFLEHKIDEANDNIAPFITGLKPKYEVLESQDIDFSKDLTISDNVDKKPKYHINTKKVKWNKPGTYPFTVTAVDKKGNKRNYFSKIKVIKVQKIAYLTFDDGPSYPTLKLLKILKKYKVKATFFVTHQFPRYEYILKKIHQGGHRIEIHSYSHNYSKIYTGEKAFYRDLNKMRKVIRKYTKKNPKLIRFPGGASNMVSREWSKGIMKRLVKKLHKDNYKIFDWNCMIGDADLSFPHTVDNYFASVRSCASYQKRIYLLSHDIYDTSVDSMEKIIPYLLQHNFKILPLTINSPEYIQHINN